MNDDLLDLILKHTWKTATNPNDYHVVTSLFSVELYSFFKYNGLNETRRRLENMSKHINQKTNYLVIPITCDYDNVSDHIQFKTDYHDKSQPMRHWILAIVNQNTRTIFMYDSMNIPGIQQHWGDLIRQWLDCEHTDVEYKIRPFKGDMQPHQSGSVNCGYFVGLYFHLHTLNINHSNVEKLKEYCTETLIEAIYKPNVKRLKL